MSIKQRMSALLQELNAGIYEKEEVMALAVLSSIAGESIFLLGPPGVAKSLIARRLKYAYNDDKVFEYLMSRFSTPDEIFGPVALSKLKEDTYERIIDNYLPAASVVFLDEIWKAGPSIQNALLTILNEKVYRNGAKEIAVPMKALIAASNELPAKDQGLEALWDRFLVRLIVLGVEDRQKFDAMIAMPAVPFTDNLSGRITNDEYQRWSAEIDRIKISGNIFNVIHVIRAYIEQHNQNEERAEKRIAVSDRRWRKIVRLLRTSAFLNDRTDVDLMDCFLIRHCIWNDECQIDRAFQFVSDAIEKEGYAAFGDFAGIKKELLELQSEVDEETQFVTDTQLKILVNARNDYYEIINPPDPNNALIDQIDFKSLTNAEQNIKLYYQSYQQVKSYSTYNIRKGSSKFSIIINEREYQLKTITKKEKLRLAKKPRPQTEEAWDKRIASFLEYTGSMKKRIEQYRNKDEEHLRSNLFVKPALAAVITAHITAALKEIDKIEIESRAIQNNYKKLERKAGLDD